MPAPAVIPAPIAYIKVVAVKKLVVGLLGQSSLSPTSPFWDSYCEKIRVFQAGVCRNTLAWNNECF